MRCRTLEDEKKGLSGLPSPILTTRRIIEPLRTLGLGRQGGVGGAVQRLLE